MKDKDQSQTAATTPGTLTGWVEIARTGTFRDSAGRPHTFSHEDFDYLVKNHDPQKSGGALVFGHPKVSDPSYGWVSALKREGEKFLAQFAHVPEAVKQLVENKRYRFVSMSLTPDKKHLLHVGLLGAVPPAIDGLEPVSFSQEETVTIDFSLSPEGNGMDEETKKLIEGMRAEIDALKAQLAEVTKGKADAEKAVEETKAEFSAYRTDVEDDRRKARIAALVKAGRLTPAKGETALTFAKALSATTTTIDFSSPDGKTEKISPEEHYFRELESATPDQRFSNFSAPENPLHVETSPPVSGDITSKL